MAASYASNSDAIWLLRLKKAARKWLSTSYMWKLFLAVLLAWFTGTTIRNVCWVVRGSV